MQRLKIGVSLAGLGLALRRALQDVERLGVDGVEIPAVGDLAPKALSQTGRQELRHRFRSHNLALAAVGCPLRHGLDTVEGQEGRIDHVKQVMSLSYELGVRVVVIPGGKVPEDLDAPAARRLTEALVALGQHGDRTGVMLALESGFDPGDKLHAYLERFDTGGLGVTFDPGSLLLGGFDPYASALALCDRVVYAHARDARNTSAGRAGQEVPLGHGAIDWMQLLAVFEEIDYRSWLTIVRESGENRLGEVAAGVQFLRRFIPNP